MTSKVYASAADAVADITDGATLAVGGFGLCGIPGRADRGARRRRRDRPRGLLQQLRRRRPRAWGAAGAGPDPPRHRLLRRREQGVRPAVPRRRTRGRADPAGHARRTHARRRRRHPGVLHPRRGRQPGLRRRPAVAVRRRRLGRDRLAAQGDPRVRGQALRAGGVDQRRLRAGARPAAATPTATSSSTRRR